MHFASTLIITVLAAHVSAEDVYLYYNKTGCSGTGLVCPAIKEFHCCDTVPTSGPYYSGYLGNWQPGDVAVFGTKKCAKGLGASEANGTCVLAGKNKFFAGAWTKTDWVNMDQLGECKGMVQGDPMFSDGEKAYVVSNAKMAQSSLMAPVDEAEAEEFFKEHADMVLDVN